MNVMKIDETFTRHFSLRTSQNMFLSGYFLQKRKKLAHSEQIEAIKKLTRKVHMTASGFYSLAKQVKTQGIRGLDYRLTQGEQENDTHSTHGWRGELVGDFAVCLLKESSGSRLWASSERRLLCPTSGEVFIHFGTKRWKAISLAPADMSST